MSLQKKHDDCEPATQLPLDQSHKLDARNFTILIVDDSLVSLQILVESFQLLGYRVLLAANGEEALRVASDTRPDIILLDIVMPGMDGLETCRRIKAQASTQDIPVIFMTALARIGDKISGFQAGAVDYLVKPVRIEEAVARIDTHLKLRDMQRELKETNAELMRQRETLEQQVALRTAELSVKNMRLRTEIAERKRMEQSLRNREREFRTLTENSPDIMVRFDTACRRVYVNPAYEKKNGIPGSALLGKTPTEFSVNIYPVAALYQEKIETVLQTGVACEFDLDWHTLDGKWLCYSVYVVPEYDETGKIASALTISRDITERRESEALLRTSKEQLQALMKQIETAREDERKYIARELHDELGQLLTGLRMRARLLHPDFLHNDPVWLKECSTDIVRIVDHAVDVVRDVVSALRPGILEMGIASALRWLGDELAQSSGVPCKVSVPQEKISLDDKTAITLFRIAQESLTNVAKHAKATRAMIALSLRDHRIRLSISDNGTGFDPAAPRNPDSYGLAGMEERVRMLGGQYEINSTSRKGTTIVVTIPLPETAMQFHH